MKTKFVVVFLLLISTLSFGQEAQTISFGATQTSIYQHPMLIGTHWDAMYGNGSIEQSVGTIIITDKSFKIILSGHAWEATIRSRDTYSGVTTYRGKWTDNAQEAKLVVTTRGMSYGPKLYSRRIVDTGVVIDGKPVKFNDWECYEKITTFFIQ